MHSVGKSRNNCLLGGEKYLKLHFQLHNSLLFVVVMTKTTWLYLPSVIPEKGALEPGSTKAGQETQIHVMDRSWLITVSILHISLDNTELMVTLEIQVLVSLRLTHSVDRAASDAATPWSPFLHWAFSHKSKQNMAKPVEEILREGWELFFPSA